MVKKGNSHLCKFPLRQSIVSPPRVAAKPQLLYIVDYLIGVFLCLDFFPPLIWRSKSTSGMTAESYRSSKATTKTLLLNYLTALPVSVTLKSLMLLAAQPTWKLRKRQICVLLISICSTKMYPDVFSFLTRKDNEARLSQGV
ncbi:hypothetical protein CPB85DRAFT_834882 [Mucidula mucida]|nr:hypothetical protein CPB85DRAFT_834882 [Mucidula mucida]